jgi:iron-sulfur cluster assembly protein
MVRVSLEKGEALLDGLLRQGHPVTHDCGGSLACASCIVIVREGAERLSAQGEDEQDILERASLSAPGSRLACQALAQGGDFVVDIPHAAAPGLAAAAGLRAVSLSEQAARHFAVQLAKRPQAIGVRLSVQPSGCSGFGYRLDFADAVGAGDTVFESGRIRILVDTLSLPYVQGAAIDVAQEGLTRRLRFDNPNARHRCGCGESFGT